MLFLLFLNIHLWFKNLKIIESYKNGWNNFVYFYILVQLYLSALNVSTIYSPDKKSWVFRKQISSNYARYKNWSTHDKMEFLLRCNVPLYHQMLWVNTTTSVDHKSIRANHVWKDVSNDRKKATLKESKVLVMSILPHF